MQRLTNSKQIEETKRSIERLLGARGEWLVSMASRKKFNAPLTFTLNRGEFELQISHGKLLLALPDGAGLWRVAAWEQEDKRLRFELSRRMGAERTVVEFVPRASTHEAREALREARLMRCLELAQMARASLEQIADRRAYIERAKLSAGARRSEPGRYARILLRHGGRNAERFIAVTGAVVEIAAGDVESFLASALLWFERLRERFEMRRGRAEIAALWLIAPRDLANDIAEGAGLLRADFQKMISICAFDEEGKMFEHLRAPKLEELFENERAPRLAHASHIYFTETALRLRELEPRAIDIVRGGRGDTLRFRGLPFARVRKIAGEEKVWFGVGARRQILDQENEAEFIKLLDDLKEYRRADEMAKTTDTRSHRLIETNTHRAAHETGANLAFDFSDESGELDADFKADSLSFAESNDNSPASDLPNDDSLSCDELKNDDSPVCDELDGGANFKDVARHAFYSSAPEAWLEFLLRKDVSKLDPALRLAPLHAQFRASNKERRAARPVDLLALRRDGRLVVIELKVAEDLTLPLQGADYWLRVERYRRAGNIRRARLFDDAEILDAPPLVYLVAPMLRFHRKFNELARMINPAIEIYRFDINEDWRTGVRVIRRERVD